LALLTFYISIMPFYCPQDPKNKRWIKAMFRIMNVLVGCVLGAVLSVSILPRSTVQILQRKIENQIKLAGEASQAVMHIAAENFSNNACVPIFLEAADNDGEVQEETLQQRSKRIAIAPGMRRWRRAEAGNAMDLGNEVALQKHESAIQESRLIKSQLNMLKYDPFQFGTPDEVMVSFRTEVAHTLARALRIQHTVVLLDGIVRNDPKHDFSEAHINLFADIGTLIAQTLSVPLNQFAVTKLRGKMEIVRGYIIELSAKVAMSSNDVPAMSSRHDLAGMWEDEDGSEGALENGPVDVENEKSLDGSRVHALLFLQLVEHLAFRSVRLYESWKFCQHLCFAVERRDRRHASLLKLKDYYQSFHSKN